MSQKKSLEEKSIKFEHGQNSWVEPPPRQPNRIVVGALKIAKQKIGKIPTRCVLVDNKNNTLNRLKDYLSGFWQYYQSSPSLQKALEIAR